MNVCLPKNEDRLKKGSDLCSTQLKNDLEQILQDDIWDEFCLFNYEKLKKCDLLSTCFSFEDATINEWIYKIKVLHDLTLPKAVT